MTLDGPVAISFMLGDRCNSNCVMCRHQGVRLAGSPVRWPELRQDRWPNTVVRWPDLPVESVRDVLVRYGASLQSVTLSSFGEPLLHPQFEEVFRLAAENNRLVGVVTNGSLVHRYADLIAQTPGGLTVSIDSPFPAHFAEIRRGLELPPITTAIQRVIQHPRKAANRTVNINMTVTTANVGEVAAMIAFCRTLGVHSLSILCGKTIELSQVPGTAVQLGDPRIRSQIPSDLSGLFVLDCVTSGWWMQGTERPCRGPFRGFDVDPDGSCIPCCRAPDAVLGHVGEDVWNGEEIRALRRQLDAGTLDPERFYVCARCPASRREAPP